MAMLINTAKICAAGGSRWRNPRLDLPPTPLELEGVFLASAEAAGWKVIAEPMVGRDKADALISKGKYRYVVEIKTASEGRRDRLVASLSQAILQARSFASSEASRCQAPGRHRGTADSRAGREGHPGVCSGTCA